MFLFLFLVSGSRKNSVFSGSHLSRSEISKEQLPFFSMLGWLKVSVQSVLRKSRPGFPVLGHDSEFKPANPTMKGLQL